MIMNKVFLGIGTNLGDREANLNSAFNRIEEFIGKILRSSSVYETDSWGFSSDNKFLNVVIEVETTLKASGVLGAILMIETLGGRQRGAKQYTSRVIDIDILIYDDLIIGEESLKIPHPLMHERKFVLIPLCEIAPDNIHPVMKVSFSSLLKSCPDISNVKRYG